MTKPMVTFARRLRRWRAGLINFFFQVKEVTSSIRLLSVMILTHPGEEFESWVDVSLCTIGWRGISFLTVDGRPLIGFEWGGAYAEGIYLQVWTPRQMLSLRGRLTFQGSIHHKKEWR